MAILEVKNLNLGFQCEEIFRPALFDVSFSLEKGKMLSIVCLLYTSDAADE